MNLTIAGHALIAFLFNANLVFAALNTWIIYDGQPLSITFVALALNFIAMWFTRPTIWAKSEINF